MLIFILNLYLSFSNPVSKDSIVKFEYHNYDSLVSVVNLLKEKCKGMGEVFSIGKSVQNRELLVMRIGRNGTRFKPQFAYIGNIHGNEPVSKEILLKLAEDICGYSTDENMKKIVDKVEISLLFSLNPDGFENSTQDCMGLQGRFNSNGVDLNRNFEYPGYVPGESIQPETKAVMDWFASSYISFSAALHGGDKVVSYPYDGDVSMKKIFLPSDDQKYILDVSKRFAQESGPKFLTGCGTNFDHGTVNGALWYPIVNSLQDHVMYKTSGLHVTLELSCCKYPPASELEDIYNMFKNPLLGMIKDVLRGVKGHIRSEKSAIKNAKISFKDGGKPIGTSKDGYFIKNLNPGKYEMIVEIQTEDGKNFKIDRTVQVLDGFEYTIVDIEI